MVIVFPGESEACHPRCLPARLSLTTCGDSERLAFSSVIGIEISLTLHSHETLGSIFCVDIMAGKRAVGE